jgi:chromosome condensin MukBEF ATPase and DNA-binding subunit MukB
MTKDEALKQALEALEFFKTLSLSMKEMELAEDAITTIKEALDECDEDELIIRYHEMTIKRLEKHIEELTAQPEDRNFCQRCGKRTADLTTIHTCTPPQSQWVGLTVDELIDLERKHLSHENLTRAIEAKLREKNT